MRLSDVWIVNRGVLPLIHEFLYRGGRREILIGVPKGSAVDQRDTQHWTDSLLAKYPHTIQRNSEVPDAVALYRQVLAREADHSVVIITVGFLTNLSGPLAGAGPVQRIRDREEDQVRAATGARYGHPEQPGKGCISDQSAAGGGG